MSEKSPVRDKVRFVASTKSDIELDEEVEQQGGPVDNRPLYERLEEQRKKLEKEQEERTKYRGQEGLTKEEIRDFEQMKELQRVQSEQRRKAEEDLYKQKMDELHRESLSSAQPAPSSFFTSRARTYGQTPSSSSSELASDLSGKAKRPGKGDDRPTSYPTWKSSTPHTVLPPSVQSKSSNDSTSKGKTPTQKSRSGRNLSVLGITTKKVVKKH